MFPKLDFLHHSKEDYRNDYEVMHQMMELVVKSLDDASRNGVPLLSGGKMHPIPIGNKGDWPYLVSRHYFFFEVRVFYQFLGYSGRCLMKLWISYIPIVPSKASSARLQRSFRNVPRAASSKAPCTGICHWCLGGKPGYDYEDVPLETKT